MAKTYEKVNVFMLNPTESQFIRKDFSFFWHIKNITEVLRLNTKWHINPAMWDVSKSVDNVSISANPVGSLSNQSCVQLRGCWTQQHPVVSFLLSNISW